MAVIVSVLEHSRAPIQVREQLSFSRAETLRLSGQIAREADGCVLLSTCNRTELYVSAQDISQVDPGRMLCSAAASDYLAFKNAFETLSEENAVHHLMEVAAGLRSLVFGEDQIISQVKNAIADAREAKAANGELETLFRTAVSAGKEVRSRVRITPAPTSAASGAVDLLRDQAGSLAGKNVLVIGNGEMGRLTATLLRDQGCNVTVTLRSYRHGETVVPSGCRAVPYSERLSFMEAVDILVSATTSPHYTITVEDVSRIAHSPKWMMDLSVPRDIDPEVAVQTGVRLYNLDDLREDLTRQSVPPLVHEIIDHWEHEFWRWKNYKDCIPTAEELKQAIIDKIRTEAGFQCETDADQVASLAVSRSVELIMGGLEFTPESVAKCSQKIRDYTKGKPVLAQKANRRASYDRE